MESLAIILLQADCRLSTARRMRAQQHGADNFVLPRSMKLSSSPTGGKQPQLKLVRVISSPAAGFVRRTSP